MDFTKAAVLSWMRAHRSEAVDARTGEVDMTKLAEDAARAFDVDSLGGPLDDSDHWIWELALKVAS